MLSDTRNTHSRRRHRDQLDPSRKPKPLQARTLLALPTAVFAAALFGPPLLAATAATTPTQTAGSPQSIPAGAAPSGTSNGIIMRDGGVCDPIRHIGC